MKAARFYGPGDIRIDDIPEPKTRPGTVMVEVEWCGICGTDLHEYLEGPIFAPTADAPHPLTGEAMPITLGHEFARVVHEVGDGVDDVHVGDRVVVEPYIICGHCDACTQGRYNVCQSVGFRRPVGFRWRLLAVCRRGASLDPPTRRPRHRRRCSGGALGYRPPRGQVVRRQAQPLSPGLRSGPDRTRDDGGSACFRGGADHRGGAGRRPQANGTDRRS